MRNSFVVLAAMCASAGCSPAAESDPFPEAEADHSVEVWEGTTSSGIAVSVRPDSLPITAGPTRFHVSFAESVPEGTALSVDLVSPEMPMMGVLRYPLEAADGGYLVHTEIPMAGLWEIYVNVGYGSDAAAFDFEVEPVDGSDPHAGHTAAVADDTADTAEQGHGHHE